VLSNDKYEELKVGVPAGTLVMVDPDIRNYMSLDAHGLAVPLIDSRDGWVVIQPGTYGYMLTSVDHYCGVIVMFGANRVRVNRWSLMRVRL
jgi:hypothetical protein